MKIIALAQHKGGSGKTTTAHWLAHHFAFRLNKHVLLIDLDPQGNLSKMSGYRPPIEGYTVADVLRGRERLAKVIRPGRHERIDIVPADIRLEDAITAIAAEPLGFRALKKALAGLTPGQYDYVLIDCQPSANILVVNALHAATHVIIPARPEEHDIDGAKRIYEMQEWLQTELREAPTILGVIATQVNERTHRHAAGLTVLPKPLLGKIPLRQGLDAEYDIRAAYGEAADAILQFIEGEGDHAPDIA